MLPDSDLMVEAMAARVVEAGFARPVQVSRNVLDIDVGSTLGVPRYSVDGSFLTLALCGDFTAAGRDSTVSRRSAAVTQRGM